jgi:hypothetical protein
MLWTIYPSIVIFGLRVRRASKCIFALGPDLHEISPGIRRGLSGSVHIGEKTEYNVSVTVAVLDEAYRLRKFRLFNFIFSLLGLLLTTYSSKLFVLKHPQSTLFLQKVRQ